MRALRKPPYSRFRTAGMSRRHFLQHLGGGLRRRLPAFSLTHSLTAAGRASCKRQQKAAILLWMGGGPSTLDLWDLKPGAATGGALPADQHLWRRADLRASAASGQADAPPGDRAVDEHAGGGSRSRPVLHAHRLCARTPRVEHPGYGSVIAHELMRGAAELELPPFVSVGGGSVGPGFLGNGLGTLRGQFERRNPRSEIGRRRRAMLRPSDGRAATARTGLRRSAARSGGQRSCQGAGEDRPPDDQPAARRLSSARPNQPPCRNDMGEIPLAGDA